MTGRPVAVEAEPGEGATEWGVRLTDGRVIVFRYRAAAVEHIEYLRKTRRYSTLVSREVVYTPWVDAAPSPGPEGDDR